MPWISRYKLEGMQNSVEMHRKHADQRLESVREVRKLEKLLAKTLNELGQVLPEAALLVEVHIHDYDYAGNFYYDLDRSGLDDVLESRKRKAQDDFAAEFDKIGDTE